MRISGRVGEEKCDEQGSSVCVSDVGLQSLLQTLEKLKEMGLYIGQN